MIMFYFSTAGNEGWNEFRMNVCVLTAIMSSWVTSALANKQSTSHVFLL